MALMGASSLPLAKTSHGKFRVRRILQPSDSGGALRQGRQAALVSLAPELMSVKGQTRTGETSSARVRFRPKSGRSRANHRLLSRTPGFRPSVNSKPAASSTCRRLSMVRLRSLSPRSYRTTVSGDTFAAAASFLTLKPIAALAIRHCTGSTFSHLSLRTMSASSSCPGAFQGEGAAMLGLSSSAAPQCDDQRGSESASANHIEDQQKIITA
jgi:hypothetical protein